MEKLSLKRALISFLALLMLVLTACGEADLPSPTPPTAQPPTPTPFPEAKVAFHVTLPASLIAGETLSLSVMDEVAGLALSSRLHTMQAEDATHYSVELLLPVNGVIKYRYVRQGTAQMEEHISDGRAVRYRMYLVQGPGSVLDVVSRWTDSAFSGPTGRISGKVTGENGESLPGILVAAGGAQTLSNAAGDYLLEGLPPGTHNLVAYAMDGAYQPFQQGAVVAPESTTPASLHLQKAPLVKVTFNLTAPQDTFPAVPIRLAGNLSQLGNTFGDLSGGVSMSAARMPVLSPVSNGRYSITLDLPQGAYLRYKYTLGDGLWNAEHNAAGEFSLRELVVPGTNLQVDDQVATWRSGKSAPITFQVTVPQNTPAGDFVSIQFNPAFGWTEPVPMWRIDARHWMYVLFSPLETLGSIGYRYCRNGLCGSADDSHTPGLNAAGRVAHTGVLPETLVDEVTSWAWINAEAEKPITLPNIAARARGQDFLAGVELQPAFHPSWMSLIPLALGDVAGMNAGWAVLTPTWTFTRSNLPVLEPVAGQDPLWPDTLDMVAQARLRGLNAALFPTPRFPGGSEEWWKFGTRDFSWWVVWFERYRSFAVHHADLAARSGSAALVLGGDWLSPALPGGKLSDGSDSSVPEDASERWRSLLSEVRSHYQGSLLWALPYPQGVQNPPPFLDAVDGIYLLWSAPLAAQAGASEMDMAAEAGRLLDADIQPFQAQIGKPVVLALAYPSIKGAAAGCPPSPQGGCLPLEALSPPSADYPHIQLDLEEQLRAYSGMFLAVNERDWIAGVVSRGYYPPAVLHDKSTSVHGKPARGVLWYWFPKWKGGGQ